MACPHEPEVVRVLLGELGADQTRRVMDHIRGCDDCRQRLTLHSSLPKAAGYEAASPQASGAAPQPVAPESGGHPENQRGTPVPTAPPRYQRYTWDEIEDSRRKKAPRLMRGVALIILVLGAASVFTRGESRSEPDAFFDPADRAVAAAGSPVVVRPGGELPTWPRIVSLLVPAPFEGVTLRISQAGSPLYEHTYTLDSPGVVPSPPLAAEREGEGEVIPLHLPFPPRSKVGGDPALPLALHALASDGKAGIGTEVSIAPAEKR